MSVTTLGLVSACHVSPISSANTMAGSSATNRSRISRVAGTPALARPFSAPISPGSTFALMPEAIAARCAGSGTLRSLSASGGISDGFSFATTITKTM